MYTIYLYIHTRNIRATLPQDVPSLLACKSYGRMKYYFSTFDHYRPRAVVTPSPLARIYEIRECIIYLLCITDLMRYTYIRDASVLVYTAPPPPG